MAVDLTTLALELDTGGLAQGEKKAGVILNRLEKSLDRAVQKALEFERRISKAFNFSGAGNNSSAFAKIEAEFQKHADRIEAIAKQSAARISKIYSEAFTVKGGGVPSAPSAPRTGGGRAPVDNLKKQEAAILSLAQAQARLEVAEGRSAQAAQTLRTALSQVTAGTAGAIRAQTQLVGIEANLATAAGKAETAMLNQARAVARTQQIAGDTAGAIRTLDEALKKASNPNSLAATRAQLQKTYLDTNYANSPLIGAIRETGNAFSQLLPLLGPVGTGIQRAIGFASGVKRALSDTQKQAEGTITALSNSVTTLGQSIRVGEAAAASVARAATATQAVAKVPVPQTQATDDVSATQARLRRAYQVSAAIAANSKAEQIAAVASRQLGQAEGDRAAAQRAAIVANARVREKAISEIAREDKQVRALISAERDRIAQAGKIETALQRQAAQAGKAAGAFGIFARAKQAAMSFFREEGGSASATDFFLNLSKVAAQSGDRLRSSFSGIRDSIGNIFKGSSAQGLFAGLNDQIAKFSKGATIAGAALTVALTAPLVALAPAAVRSAVEIDKSVNVLRAFTGGAENAEKRLAELIATAQRTPGLTTSLALDLDTQLRTAGATAKTIDRILPAIGKLNAASPLGDPRRFSQNLVQLVTQGYEKIDLKELVGQSPLAGELVKQIFSVDSPINGEAIRASAQKLGLTSVDAFFSAFADAAARNTKLAGIGESLGTQIEKLRDRITIALRPLGTVIVDLLAPVAEKVVGFVEGISNTFASLPEGARKAVVAGAVLGPLLITIGGLAQGALALSIAWKTLQATLAASGAAAALPGLINPVTGAVVGLVAVLGIAIALWASYESATDKAAKITVNQINAVADARNEYQQLSNSLTTSTDKHKALTEAITKLPASAQAVAGALQTEGEKLAFVSAELERQRNIREGFGAAQQATLTAGLIESQRSLELIRQTTEGFKDSSTAAEQARKEGKDFYSVLTGNTTAIKALEAIGNALGEQEKLEKAAIATRNEAALKLKTLQDRYGGTTQGVIDFASASGKSSRDVNFLTKALEQAEKDLNATRNGAEAAAGGMDALAIAAQKASQDVAKAFLQFDLAGLNDNVKAKIDKLAAKLAQEGNVTKVRAKELFDQSQKELERLEPKGSDFAVGVASGKDLNDRRKALEKSRDLFQDLFSPPTRGSGGGSRSRAAKDISELDQLTKQLREAEKDVSSFQNVASKEFGLRIKLEDTRRFKSQLEEIITLRRELNEPLRAPLPTDKRGADAAIARLNALKELREAESKFDPRSAFLAAQEATIAATVEQITQLDRLINGALPKVETATTAAALAQNEYFLALAKTNPALAEQYRQQATATDAAIQAAETSKTFKSIQDALTGDLDRFKNLTREQTTALELQRAGITDLTSAEAQRTLGMARQIDGQDALQRAYEESQRVTEQFASTTKDLFITLFEDGPRAFADRTLNTFKRLFADIAADIATSGIMRLLGIGGGQQQQGGGILANLFNRGGNTGTGNAYGSPAFATASGPAFGNAPIAANSPLGRFGLDRIFGQNPAQQVLTGGFSGGNPAQQILSGGGGQGSSASSLLSRLPIIGKFFAPAVASAPSLATGLGANIGSLPGVGTYGSLPLGTPPIAASGLPQASGGLLGGLGGLGAGGLLAGGGLLGSLLGGSSPTGKLLGGIGGTLGAGAVGASGILGGGIASALPALFSNPITAIIGGGLLATALAFKIFGGGDFKKYQKAVDSTYAIRIANDKEGKSVFEQSKQIGEQAFGKGSFKNRIKETIALKDVKDLIAAYGETTGQENSPLVKRAMKVREISEVGNASNNFVKRAMGGLIPAPYFKTGFVNFPNVGRDNVATALSGGEYVARASVTSAQGIGRFDALNSGRASILRHDQRGASDLIRLLESGKIPLFSKGMRERLLAQLRLSETATPSETFLRRATGGFVGDALPFSAPVQMPTYARADYTPTIPQQPAAQSANSISSAELTGLRVMMAAVAETVANLDAHINAVPAGHVFVAGMRGNEAALADAASQGFAQSTTATQNAQRILGVQQ